MGRASDKRSDAAFETVPREAWVIVTGKNKRSRKRHMLVATIRSTRTEAWGAFSDGMHLATVRQFKRRGHMAVRLFLSTEMAEQ